MLATLVAVRKDRDAKAELNRRSQICEVLADTGIRVARNGIPCWNCTSLCGFANRCLHYSTNGMEIGVQA